MRDLASSLLSVLPELEVPSLARGVIVPRESFEGEAAVNVFQHQKASPTQRTDIGNIPMRTWQNEVHLYYDDKGGCVVTVGHVDEPVISVRTRDTTNPAQAIVRQMGSHMLVATSVDDLAARLSADGSIEVVKEVYEN